MRVKEIILEGFKSYHDRTVLSQLDPQFNAITGLNGSGKSNILDAICFVLGLQTVKLARVETLRELIYKNGQGGIKTATVTVVFSNKEFDKCPVGFEPGRDIVVSRTIKTDTSEYRVNGQRYTTGQVKNIFKGIGLDIENYQTFFVQQGRIMSIVNFQPRELMSFVEEAANVSYYNTVKSTATDQMSKAETKVTIIDRKVDVDLPEKLKKAESEFREFQRLQDVTAKLTEAAENVLMLQRRLNRGEEENIRQNIAKKTEERTALAKERNHLRKVANDCKVEIGRLEVQIQSESVPGEREQAIKDYEVKRRELDAKAKERRGQEGDADAKRQKLGSTEAALEKEKAALQNLELEKASYMESIQKMAAQFDKIRVALSADPNVSDKLVRSELEAAKTELNECVVKLERVKQNLERGKTELSEALEKRIKNEAKTAEIKQRVEKLQQEREECERSVREGEKKTLSEQLLKSRTEDVQNKWQIVSHSANAMLKVMSNKLAVSLAPHTPPDIRSKIYGRLNQLVEFPDEASWLAMEVLAEGKLNYVVVEDSKTVTEILQKKYVTEKIKFLTLDKVVYSTLNPNHLAKAQELARRHHGAVYNPMELIRVDKKFLKAAEFVFGNRLIASDLELANQICFDKDIGRVVVTFDGDKVAPSGALDGGYFDPRNLLIPKAREYKTLTDELRGLEVEQQKLEAERSVVEQHKDRLAKMQTHIRNLQKEEEIVLESLSKNSLEELNRQVTQLSTRLGNLEFEERKLEGQRAETQQRLDKLSAQLRKSRGGNNKEFLEQEMEGCRQEQERLESMEKKAVTELMKRTVALRSLEEELDGRRRAVDLARDKAKKLKLEEDDLRREVDALGEVVKDNEERYNDAMKRKAALDLEKKELEQRAADLESSWELKGVQLTETSQVIDGLEKDLQLLLREKEQLERQRQAREEVMDDGSEVPLAQTLRKLEAMKAAVVEYRKEVDRLSKKVDKSAELNFSQLSARISQVSQMKEQIHSDRGVMVATMGELDLKRDEAIEMCFQAVKKSLGQIFGSLLPGAFAEMNMEDIQDRRGQPGRRGIKIRISLGGKWKDSLTELSGGQRSLLALSFLLALLRYRPAPFYILDEVDSALDLSHTENLGGLLSLQFPQSQFIAISLKEEFYSHANVLFKTSLVQGYSVVDRIQLRREAK